MKARVKGPKDVHYWGLDRRPEDRPGVPRETPPHPLPGAHWSEPARQPVKEPVLTRAGISRPTPVFSAALPPKGLSGALRRIALAAPDHRVRHWLFLFLADRIDVVQNLPALLKRRGAKSQRRRSPASKTQQRS